METEIINDDHERRDLLIDYPIITYESNPELMQWLWDKGVVAKDNVVMLSEWRYICKMLTTWGSGTKSPLYFMNQRTGVKSLDELRFCQKQPGGNYIACQNSYSFEYITVPDHWTTIYESLFRSNPWKRVIIGKNVQTATTRTFYQWSNTSNTVIILKPTTPPTLSGSNNYLPTGTKMYVPDNSVDLYKEQWTDHTSKIYPISECPEEYLYYNDLGHHKVQLD